MAGRSTESNLSMAPMPPESFLVILVFYFFLKLQQLDLNLQLEVEVLNVDLIIVHNNNIFYSNLHPSTTPDFSTSEGFTYVHMISTKSNFWSNKADVVNLLIEISYLKIFVQIQLAVKIEQQLWRSSLQWILVPQRIFVCEIATLSKAPNKF